MSEPLKLADGTLVFPDGRVVTSGGDTEVSSRSTEVVAATVGREASRLVVSARKKLTDLPDVPKNMNAIGIVLAYTLFGLDDDEIALAMGVSVSQLIKIKSTDAYNSFHDAVMQSVLTAESGDVRDIIQKNARAAVAVMFDGLASSKAADRISAAKDILDRSGFRPNDVVEHRHRLDGGLVIEIVRKDDHVLPTIDIELEH